MPTAHLHHNYRKYDVYLAADGDITGYAVEVCARGKGPTMRRLWDKADRKPMPQGLKDVLNARGACEGIALAMGWDGKTATRASFPSDDQLLAALGPCGK